MKIYTFFLAIILSSLNLSAKKYLILTDRIVENISIICDENSNTELIKIATKDNKNFSFETEETNNLYFKVPIFLNFKLYSVNENKTSTWFRIEKEKVLPMNTILDKMLEKNISLKEFQTGDFIINPISKKQKNLRSEHENVFLSSNYQNFEHIEDVFIYWIAEIESVGIQIYSIDELTVVYRTNSYTKNNFSYKDISEKALKNIKKGTYQFTLKGRLPNSEKEKITETLIFFIN